MRTYDYPLQTIGKRRHEELIRRGAEERLAREFEAIAKKKNENSHNGIITRVSNFISREGRRNKRLSANTASN